MKNYLRFNFIAYSFATGLNKGLLLLAIPFLQGTLVLEDYGLWNLCQVIIVVLGPILSLNGYSAIIRFGVENELLGLTLFKKYLLYSIFLALPILLIVGFRGLDWLSISLMLSIVEGIQLLLLALYRSGENYLNYLGVSMIKFVSLLATLFFWQELNINQLLLGQLFFGLFLTFGFVVSIMLKSRVSCSLDYQPWFYLKFTLLLLPHSMALWVLSSLDRVLIKSFLGETELGVYSLAYSLALILMLMNSGIGLTLPNYILKNYTNYIKSNIRKRLIFYYSLVSVAINVVLMSSIFLLKNNITYLSEVMDDFYWIIGFVFNGLYLLGIYYFYSNILFYHKKASRISVNTFVVAFINGIFTYILLIYIGVIGAAIATFFSYFIYVALNFYAACKIERGLVKDIVPVGIILAATVFINFSYYYLITYAKIG